jgi:nitrogenase molybdenum-iron protein alpha/beta subunit
MNGNEMLKKLGRLSEITSMKDVRQLTTAMFPGTHCPLMGAAMAIRGIQDAYMLLVGTDECAYYTKHMTLYSQDFGGVDGRCFSVVLDAQNVTFGCAAKVEEAFDELAREYHPKAVLLVTTCIPELIGDDMDAIADGLSQQYDLPVMAVHTEHFKCDNHLPGLERTITACLDMMEPQEVDGSVNLLGQRMGRFDTTELCHVLKHAGVEIGMQLPCGCSVDEIRRGPRAKVNIVVNDIAIPLAKKMQRRFGTPWVFGMPYGYQATLDWLREIGTVLGREPEPYVVSRLREKAMKAAMYQMYGRMLKQDKAGAVLVGEYHTLAGLGDFLSGMGISVESSLCLHSLRCVKEPQEPICHPDTERERMDILGNVHRKLILGDDISFRMCPKDNVFLRIALPVIRGAQTADYLPLMGEKGADFILETVEEYFQLVQ